MLLNFSDRRFGLIEIEITDIGITAIEFKDVLAENVHSIYETEKAEEIENNFIKRFACFINSYPFVENDFTIGIGGTDFQKKVWKEVMRIPIGTTLSYKELAELCGCPKGWRAVANAVAKNRVALIIPCHRVVPTGGGIGKYRWGKDLKKKILDIEKQFSLTTSPT